VTASLPALCWTHNVAVLVSYDATTPSFNTCRRSPGLAGRLRTTWSRRAGSSTIHYANRSYWRDAVTVADHVRRNGTKVSSRNDLLMIVRRFSGRCEQFTTILVFVSFLAPLLRWYGRTSSVNGWDPNSAGRRLFYAETNVSSDASYQRVRQCRTTIADVAVIPRFRRNLIGIGYILCWCHMQGEWSDVWDFGELIFFVVFILYFAQSSAQSKHNIQQSTKYKILQQYNKIS